ncbi:hypothetical protein D3C78_998110 [compost metagenome]
MWWSSSTTRESMTLVDYEDITSATENYVNTRFNAIVAKQAAVDTYKSTLVFHWWQWRRKRKTSMQLVREDAAACWESVSWYLNRCGFLTEEEADILDNYEAEKLHRICATLAESKKDQFVVSENLLKHINKWMEHEGS